MAWNPSGISDQRGRTFVVTGANGGLGKTTTRMLADKGAAVVMACGNTAKAQQIIDDIKGGIPCSRCSGRRRGEVCGYTQSGAAWVGNHGEPAHSFPWPAVSDTLHYINRSTSCVAIADGGGRVF